MRRHPQPGPGVRRASVAIGSRGLFWPSEAFGNENSSEARETPRSLLCPADQTTIRFRVPAMLSSGLAYTETSESVEYGGNVVDEYAVVSPRRC